LEATESVWALPWVMAIKKDTKKTKSSLMVAGLID
jgi:hypothetical protein